MERGAAAGTDTTTRRVRSLATLVPVLLLERDRNMGAAGRDWSCYDPKLLTVVAVTYLANNSGLAGHAGVPRAELVDELVAAARRSAPERPAAEHQEVAVWLLDRLLAHDTGSRSHPVGYCDADDGYTHKIEQVRLLHEQIAADGVTVQVVLDPAAVHLILVGMDRNLEDEQVAAEAILAHQIATGRITEAVGQAEQALMLTNTYRERLSRWLREARRDLHGLDWAGTVEPQLQAALEHVSRRVDADTALRAHADDVRRNPDADTTEDAHRVVVLMDQCLKVLAALQRQLLSARTTWRDEQARQLFAPPAPLDTVDLPSAILGPLLHAPATAAGATLVEQVAVAFLPPVLPAVFAASVGDQLTRPPAQVDPAPEDTTGVLVEVEDQWRRFGPEHHERLDTLLDAAVDAPMRMSDLLTQLDGYAPADRWDMAVLLGLTALQAFDPASRGGRLTAIDDGADLRDDVLVMPDLLISAAPRTKERT